MDIIQTSQSTSHNCSLSTCRTNSITTSCLISQRKGNPVQVGPFCFQFIRKGTHNIHPSPVRSLFPLEKTPGLISLLAGKPNSSTFPFTSLSFNARSPSKPDEEVTLNLTGEELAQGLQYGDTAGIKPLLDWLHGLQEIIHGRKRHDSWRISVGSGSQDLIYKVDPLLLSMPPCLWVEPTSDLCCG